MNEYLVIVNDEGDSESFVSYDQGSTPCYAKGRNIDAAAEYAFNDHPELDGVDNVTLIEVDPNRAIVAGARVVSFKTREVSRKAAERQVR